MENGVRSTVEMANPIIGILAQESKPWDPNSKKYGSYISASYVKAVEGAGGRVVPVFIDKDVDYYKDLASKLNGFLYPGGAADVTSLTGYARSGKIIYDIVSAMNKEGDSVPILGVCLGMELIANIVAGGIDLRTPCSSKSEALSLDFHPNYRFSSLFNDVPLDIINFFAETKSTVHHHRHCITQETLIKHEQNQWNILASSTNRNNETFISAMELADQPIVSIIFHPEKIAYEWGRKQVNLHDMNSVKGARIFYDWFLSKSVLNNHTFHDIEDENNYLIYNYVPTFTGKQELYDTQVYYFNN